MGFGFGFGAFQGMFTIVFILIIVMFIGTAIRVIGQWHKNNQSPRLTVDATVIAKRANVSHHHHSNGVHGAHMTSSTSYYVTLQVESGDRMELSMSGDEYGMLVEGDRGKLSFQGTRYLGFDRK